MWVQLVGFWHDHVSAILYTPNLELYLMPGATYIFLPVVVLSYILYKSTLYVYMYIQCTDEKNRKSLHAPNLAVAANSRYLKFACAYVC